MIVAYCGLTASQLHVFFTRNKKLLGAPSKDATRSSWHRSDAQLEAHLAETGHPSAACGAHRLQWASGRLEAFALPAPPST